MFNTRRVLLVVTTLAFLTVGLSITFLLFGNLGDSTFVEEVAETEPKSESPKSESPKPFLSATVLNSDNVASEQPNEVAAPRTVVKASSVGNPLESEANVDTALLTVDETESNKAASGASPSEVTPEMLSEIASIREQIGISVFSNDSQSTEAGADESVAKNAADFREALATVTESTMRTAIDAPAATKPTGPAKSQSGDTSGERKVRDGKDSEFVSSLQASIAQLELRADQLEQHSDYITADRVRRLARKLRREVRPLLEAVDSNDLPQNEAAPKASQAE